MVRKYRGRWEITMWILESCVGEGAKKTHIMYRANLNYVSFNKYFAALAEEGLISEVDGPDGDALYRITGKGNSLLNVLRKAGEKVPKRR